MLEDRPMSRLWCKLSRRNCWIILGALVMLIFIRWHLSPPADIDEVGSTKLLLFWTPFFNAIDARSRLGWKLFQECAVSNCDTTNDRSKLYRSKAVTFHAFDINPLDLPPPRTNSQHYVFHIGESPIHSTGLKGTPDFFFDMAHTYLLTSDVHGQYLYSVPLEERPKNFAQGKSKLVAWFVSNCKTHSKREDYVKLLQQFVTVDVYGGCGPLKCPRSDEAACYDMLRRDYKFYLSFENSICQDYVTEKFTNALQNLVVPVVLGGGNLTIFPPKSYIHVDEFPTVKALADHLLYLDKNDTAYNEYMEWRFDPQLVQSYGEFSGANSGWCMLCRLMHDPTYHPAGYRDMKRWYLDSGKCRANQSWIAQ